MNTELGSNNNCHHCGGENQKSARFCRHCGKPLIEPASPSNAQDSMSIPLENCPGCGAKIRPGTKFCNQCGRNLMGALEAFHQGSLKQQKLNKSLSFSPVTISESKVLISGISHQTGLSLGDQNCYLAYCQFVSGVPLASPELLSSDGNYTFPFSVVVSKPDLLGHGVYDLWVENPTTVHSGIFRELFQDESGNQQEVNLFFRALADRLSDVYGSDILNRKKGAAMNLGIDQCRDPAQIESFSNHLLSLDFPLRFIVPNSIAALAYHHHLGLVDLGSGFKVFLVADWGSSGIILSLVTYEGSLPRAEVVGQSRFDWSGTWFEEMLMEDFLTMLPGNLSEYDQRQLILFTRKFKEAISYSFAKGKTSTSEFCVIPLGSTPTKLRISRLDFETKIKPRQEAFCNTLNEFIANSGLQSSDIDHLILMGGGAHWYFNREMFRQVVGHIPLTGQHPETTAAAGLALFY